MSIVSTSASDWEKQPARAALSVAETAETLGICEASVYRAIRRGDLPSVLIGGRRVIPTTSISKLLTAEAA
jgi:excisionase family DNA binding protein